MKKNLMKMAAVLSGLALMGTSFVGCLNKVNTNTIASSQAPATIPASALPGNEETPDTWKPVSEDELLAFIDGTAQVTVTGEGLYGLVKGDILTLEDMKDSIERAYSDTYGEMNAKSVAEIDYGIIDCGNDGIPELAVLVKGRNADGSDEVDDYYIIKKDGETLCAVGWFEAYYRSWGELNKYGVFMGNGSGGASLSIETYDRVNAMGQPEFIYSVEHELALGEPIINGVDLPSDAELPEGYPHYAEDFGNNERCKYSFAPYSYNFMDGSKEYDDYLRQMVYLFHDSEGNTIYPKDEYVNMYFDLGIVVTDDDNIAQLIKERLHELNISEEEMTTPDAGAAIDWKVAWGGK